MEQIWAPWRMELIRQPKTNECFFCQYIQQNNDENNLVLERGTHCFVVMNRYPYTNGHIMIVPYSHTGDLGKVPKIAQAEMMEYITRWQMIISQTMHPQGFNIGMNIGKVAGAGVDDHVHMHIVPRWLGDTNFIPVFSDIRIINQSLQELYSLWKNVLK